MIYKILFVSACALVATASSKSATPAGERPDPAEIPLPTLATRAEALPGVEALPIQVALPQVLLRNDGTPVTNPAEWAQRREEIKKTLSFYAVGQMPPAPGNVRGSEKKRESVLGGKAQYRLVHLTFGPKESLELDIGVFTPAGPGPFPAVILQGGPPPGAPILPRLPPGPTQGRGQDVLLVVGEMKNADTTKPPAGVRTGVRPGASGATDATATAERYANVLERGYAIALYNPNDCAEDTTLRSADGRWAFRKTRFFPAYPDYDWGILGAWAWGASRVADYLETDSMINARQLIVTGASRHGKSSLIAAAFDDRLMGAPVVTGGGGIGAYRAAGPRQSETLDIMMKKYPNWFSPHLHEFWGQREKLPFDEHWFVALCAPRPFIALEGDADIISYSGAVKASLGAARPAYVLTGAPDRLGVNYAPHAHAFTKDDWTAMLDFADKNLRGMKVDRSFDHYPTEAELDAALARGPSGPSRS